MIRVVGPNLGSLVVLFRLWRCTSRADRAKLWSAWCDILPDLREHTGRVIGGDLMRHIASRIALIELANVEGRREVLAWRRDATGGEHSGVAGPEPGARSMIDLPSSEGSAALVHRVIMAPDWVTAFRTVLAAMPAAHDADAVLGKLQAWEDRRRACLQMTALCRDDLKSPSRTAAWAILGADPAGPGWRKREGYQNYSQVLKGIADVIAAQPTLLEDEQFRDAVGGWRFLERAGSDGEEDLIVSARKYGAMGRNDASEVLAWAQRWKTQ
jgi:hypothetical protein